MQGKLEEYPRYPVFKEELVCKMSRTGEQYHIHPLLRAGSTLLLCRSQGSHRTQLHMLIFIPLPCVAHSHLLQPESKRDCQGDREASTLVRAAGKVLKQEVCRAYQLQRETERLYLRHCRTLSLPPLPHSCASRPTGPSPPEPCWAHLWHCDRNLTAQQNSWQGLHCLFQSMLLLIPHSNE